MLKLEATRKTARVRETCKRHKWGMCLLGYGDKHCVQTCTRCGDTRQHGQRLSDRALAAKAKKSQTRQKVR